MPETDTDTCALVTEKGYIHSTYFTDTLIDAVAKELNPSQAHLEARNQVATVCGECPLKDACNPDAMVVSNDGPFHPAVGVKLRVDKEGRIKNNGN